MMKHEDTNLNKCNIEQIRVTTKQPKIKLISLTNY